MEPWTRKAGVSIGRFIPPFFFIYKTMGFASHKNLARKMQLRNEILKHAMANDKEKEKAARKKLDALNKKTTKKKKK